MTVLSGAGMSAESGVPTFRDVETGLWAHVDPYEISSSDGWRRHPEKVFAWYLWRHHMMDSVQPNDGHRAVAAWQDVVVVLLALAALMLWRRPPWQVVLACGLLGWLLG